MVVIIGVFAGMRTSSVLVCSIQEAVLPGSMRILLVFGMWLCFIAGTAFSTKANYEIKIQQRILTQKE